MDNPEIGPLLAKHYWTQGNHLSHNQTIESLTGEGFNAKYLADACNLSAEDAWKMEQQKIADLSSRKRSDIAPLNAKIKVVSGETVLSDNLVSDDDLFNRFETYIGEKYGC